MPLALGCTGGANVPSGLDWPAAGSLRRSNGGFCNALKLDPLGTAVDPSERAGDASRTC